MTQFQFRPEAYAPILTIGITSFNRFLYLQALMTSLENLDRRRFQFIVVDTGSTEPQIRPYLTRLLETKQINQLHCIEPENRSWTNDEYIAKNYIIEHTKAPTILFLQDDLQFLTNQEILIRVVEGFSYVGAFCCELNAVRASTIQQNFQENREINLEGHIRFWVPRNNHFHTMGLFRTDLFKKMGPYPVEWPCTQEYWGRSEDWYDTMLKQTFPRHELNISSWVPLFAPVWNDPRGGYAFIRGDKRYGHYIPAGPQEVYYKHFGLHKYLNLQAKKIPQSFKDVAEPIGWSYAIDQNGDQVKFPQKQVMIDGPVTLLTGEKIND